MDTKLEMYTKIREQYNFCLAQYIRSLAQEEIFLALLVELVNEKKEQGEEDFLFELELEKSHTRIERISTHIYDVRQNIKCIDRAIKEL